MWPIDVIDGSGRAKQTVLSPALVGLYAGRPSVTGLPNGVRFYATDKCMEWIAYSGAWVLSAVFAPEVTSLPSSPIDQQECVFVADATNGIKWHFRYRAASASSYKWELIGGSDLRAFGAGPAQVNNNSAWGTTSMPSIVAPLSAVYDLRWAGKVQNWSVAATQSALLRLFLAGVAASGNAYPSDPLDAQYDNEGSAYGGAVIGSEGRVAAVAAQSFDVRYQNSGVQVMQFQSISLRMRPVRAS